VSQRANNDPQFGPDTDILKPAMADLTETLITAAQKREAERRANPPKPEPQEDIVRVIRLIEYQGPRSKVERQVAQSIHGYRWGLKDAGTFAEPSIHNAVKITAVTLGTYPDVIEPARQEYSPSCTPYANKKCEDPA
jgi:hypothetical protein